MSRAVLFSINKPHTDNIRAGLKKSELRKRAPKQIGPYKAYIYETLKNGGCGAVIGEFTAINKERWRICVGVPIDLCTNACVTSAEIHKYCRGGLDDLTEIAMFEVVIYDEPKALSEFVTEGDCDCMNCAKCAWLDKGNSAAEIEDDCELAYVNVRDGVSLKPIFRPPQSWCYVEELT